MASNISEDAADDLLYFARAGEVAEMKTLLDSLAEAHQCSRTDILVHVKDQGKSSCLHMASANGHNETVKFILNQFAGLQDAKKAFIDAQNEHENTSLHWAAMNGQLEVVKTLVEEGASTAIANDRNYIPLDLAALSAKNDIVDYFLAQSSGIEAGNSSGLNGSAEGIDLGDQEEDTPRTNQARGGN